MNEFRTRARDFLSEMMLHEGRGRGPDFCCLSCNAEMDDLYRCITCCADALFCASCIVKEHELRPLDMVEVSLYLCMHCAIFTDVSSPSQEVERLTLRAKVPPFTRACSTAWAPAWGVMPMFSTRKVWFLCHGRRLHSRGRDRVLRLSVPLRRRRSLATAHAYPMVSCHYLRPT